MKLELGSGYHPTPGFVHLDANPNAPHLEILGEAANLADLIDNENGGKTYVGDGTVEELRAVDVLEHISYRGTDNALAEWTRVLMPGGRLYVQVPDADTIMRWYVNRPGKLIDRVPSNLPHTSLSGAAWRLLGGHADDDNGRDDFRLNAHYSLWSDGSLQRAFDRVGLRVESITVNDHPNLCAWATKP